MSKKQIVLWIVLCDFASFQAYVLYNTQGLMSLVSDMSTLAGMAFVADLLIALSLVVVWMVSDARERGVNPWGYVALTVGTGSIGPLVYLLRRERQDHRDREAIERGEARKAMEPVAARA